MFSKISGYSVLLKRSSCIIIILLSYSTIILSAGLQYDVKNFGAKGDGVALETELFADINPEVMFSVENG